MSKLSASQLNEASSSSRKDTSTPDVHRSNRNESKPSNRSAAQYIYDSMRDNRSKSMIHARPVLRRMEGSTNISIKGRGLDKAGSGNSMAEKGGSNRSGLLSIDLDLDQHGGLFSLQADSKRSINSSDFVKDCLLSDSRDISERQLIKSGDLPVLELTAKLERFSTGDDIMDENIRASSSEWILDDIDVGPMPQSMFYDSSSSIPVYELAAAVLPDQSQGLDSLYEDALSPVASSDVQYDSQHDNGLNLNPFFHDHSYDAPPLPQLSSMTVASSETKHTTSDAKKTKKRKKRVIDKSAACEPTDDDVLFGRGGFTNNRPGNIHFRQEALRLRPWYQQSSKEEKYEISNILLESVKSKGGRFLERESDGYWYEVIGNGARRKASQALRERIKGKGAGLASSITSARSSSGDERDDTAGSKSRFEV